MAQTHAAPAHTGSPSSRHATLHTWQPHEQIERILTTQPMPFTGDVGLLITHSSQQLMPTVAPWRVTMCISRHDTCLVSVNIEFGANANGEQTTVRLAMTDADIPAMLTYVLARPRGLMYGLIFTELDESEGGDDVHLPRVTVKALADLPTPTVLQ